MLDLRQIRSFAHVAREKSFTRAAGNLNYAQSSVTAQIHALENDLGVPLFNRIGRQVELTSAGRNFLPYAEKLMNLSEEARLSVKACGEIAGPLAISASESLLTYRLPGLLQAFQCTYPAVQLSLQAGFSHIASAALEPGIDIVVTIDEPVELPQLLVQKVRRETMLAIVAADHPLAKLRRISAQEITEQQILLTENRCSYRAVFERTLMQQEARVNRSLEFGSVEALKQCVLARMGVGVLPEVVVAEELQCGALVALPWPQKRLHVYTQLVRHRDKWFSPVMQAFWKMATELLREK